MKYIIDVCHPNEFANGNWQSVDSFNDTEDMADRLASPSFAWDRGLLVRVTPFRSTPAYHGIFGSDGCVDVGCDSVIFKSTKFYTDMTAIAYRRMSFIEAYQQCHNATLLMHTICNLLSTKTLIRFLLNRCVLHRNGLSIENITNDAAYIISSYLDETRSERLVKQWFDKTYRVKMDRMIRGVSNENAEIMHAFNYLEACIRDKDHAESVIDHLCNSSTLRRHAQMDMSDSIRREIPFHEIVSNLVP